MTDSLKENTKRIKNANKKDTEIKNIFCFHFLRILMGQAKKGDLNIPMLNPHVILWGIS